MKLYCSVFLWQFKLLATEYLHWLLSIPLGQPNYWTRDAIIETSTLVLTCVPEGEGGGAQSVLEVQVEWGGAKKYAFCRGVDFF